MTKQEELRKMVEAATPGPWTAGPHDDDDTARMFWYIYGQPGSVIGELDAGEDGVTATAIGSGANPERVEANARLIAQAPTLATELAAALDRLARLEAASFPDETGFYGLIGDAMREAEKAMRKFPQPNYVVSKVAEEAGEVVKAAIHCAEGRETAENVRGEMKQLIAMLYRLWIEGDGVHGLPSVRAALAPAAPTQEGA